MAEMPWIRCHFFPLYNVGVQELYIKFSFNWLEYSYIIYNTRVYFSFRGLLEQSDGKIWTTSK